MVYKFKTGSYRGLDAQKTGEELERIRQSDGGKLSSKRVLTEAKNAESPLHNAFTWDLERAAERCWLMEAATLIRRVVVEVGDTERPAFIHVSVSNTEDPEDPSAERYYQSVSVIASKPDEYESALGAARARLFTAQTSLDDLYDVAKENQKPSVQRARKHVGLAARELTL